MFQIAKNADEQQRSCFTPEQEMRLLTLDAESLASNVRNPLPQINRSAIGLRFLIQEKLKKLQTNSSMNTSQMNTQASHDINEFQQLVQNAKEHLSKAEIHEDKNVYRDLLLKEIYDLKKKEQRLDDNDFPEIQAYLDSFGRYQENELELISTNNMQVRNHSTMTAFYKESDNLLNIGKAFLDNFNKPFETDDFEDNLEMFCFSGNELQSIKNYVLAKVNFLNNNQPQNQSQIQNAASLMDYLTKNPNVHQDQLSENSDFNEAINKDFVLEEKHQNDMIVSRQLKEPFIQLIEQIKAQEIRQPDNIYDILINLVRKTEEISENHKSTFSVFIISHVNCLIAEMSNFLQKSFWKTIENTYSETPIPGLTQQLSTAFKIQTFINERLATYPTFYVIRDKNKAPVWGILFYLLRAGAYEKLFLFLQDYQGEFKESLCYIGVLFILFMKKIGIEIIRQNPERVDEFVNFYGSLYQTDPQSQYTDSFKMRLLEIFEGRQLTIDTMLFPLLKDSIWGMLFNSFESISDPCHFRLFGLQHKIREFNKSSNINTILQVPFYNFYALMFNDCAVNSFKLSKNKKEGILLSFLISESRLNNLMFQYERLQNPAKANFLPISNLFKDYLSQLPLYNFEDVIILSSCLQTQSDRIKILLKFSGIHDLFQKVFNIDLQQNPIKESLKKFLLQNDFKKYAMESISCHPCKEDWKNYGYFLNAYSYFGEIHPIWKILIDLKYEQIKNLVFSVQKEDESLKKIDMFANRLFIDFKKLRASSNEKWEEIRRCDQFKGLFKNYYIEKNKSLLDKFAEMRPSKPKVDFISENHCLIYLYCINLGYKLCRQEILNDKSQGKRAKIRDLCGLMETDEKSFLSEKKISSEGKIKEMNQIRDSNKSLYLEITKNNEVKGGFKI